MNRIAYTIILAFLLISCNKQISYHEDSGKIFNTYYNFKYESSQSLREDILNELNRFDNSLNPFNKNSIIAKVNNNEAVELDSLFIEVFNKSQEVSKISDGMFDITCAPLINAWGFGVEKIVDVKPQTIDSLKEFTGYEKIKLIDRQIVKSDLRTQINASAIAKGYSVDIIVRLLDSKGVKNYKCEIGGEIRTKGVDPEGKCWQIGIEKPIDNKSMNNQQLQAVIKLCDKSIATSGNYRNFYTQNGKKIAHTINPKTGYPSESNVLSVTVIANDCMTADAYATVFMLTDIEQTQKIAKEKGLDFYLIYMDEKENHQTIVSDGFKNLIITNYDYPLMHLN